MLSTAKQAEVAKRVRKKKNSKKNTTLTDRQPNDK